MRVRLRRSLQHKIAADKPGAAGYKNAILQKEPLGITPVRGRELCSGIDQL
jgi:hypothetical protein